MLLIVACASEPLLRIEGLKPDTSKLKEYSMKFNKRNLIGSLICLCTFLAMGNPAFATPDQFICAAAQAIACAQDEPCIRGSAESVNLPLLLRVSLADKAIMSLREGGEQRTSKILEVIEGEKNVVLFGIDQGSAWNIVIDRSDGKMTLTNSTYDAGYIVHGACSAKILK